MESLKHLNFAWRNMMDNESDPRVRNWFLMRSPTPTILLIVVYIYFVKVLGPRWMESRKPFQLNKLIIIYNIFQIGLSSYIFYEAVMCGWVFGGYNWGCEPVDYSYSPQAMRVAAACWVYFISKFTEFLDTVFFVLRKKNQSISFLHVFHHSIMPFGTYFGVLFVPGGHGTFYGFLNSFVHIVMYSYYLLAALGPKFQKFLWWKRYLTILQILQFVAVFIHSGQLLFRECNYDKLYVYAFMIVSGMFVFLFSNFYIKAYLTNKNVQKLSSKEESYKNHKDIDTKME